MQPARLLQSQNAGDAVKLRVAAAADNPRTGITVRRGLLAEGVLTSVHEETITADLHRNENVDVWLTHDNPFLTAEQTRDLDGRGVVKVGTVVHSGDILVSTIGRAAELRGKETADSVWVRDHSHETPRDFDGATVVRADVWTRSELGRTAPRDVHQRIEVVLRGEHSLEIGDLLLVDGEPLGVVADFADDRALPGDAQGRPVDLIVPEALGPRLGLGPRGQGVAAVQKAAQRGADAVQARSMDLYSLISLQPLSRHIPGQKLTTAQVRWLSGRGLRANLAELTALKSDDLVNRPRLLELCRSGAVTADAVPAPAAPESLATLRAHLLALGLSVSFHTSPHGVVLTARPLLDEEVRGLSDGEVRKAETVHYKTFEETEGGLFCPTIFGPVAGSRRRRFGHLELPVPVVSYLWRLGKPSPLARLLDLGQRELEKIVRYEQYVRLTPNGWETAPDMAAAADTTTGASAIESMLSRLPPASLPAALRRRPGSVAMRTLPVLPPDLRPLILLATGNWAVSDLVDLYRRVINRRNRLEKLEELKAPEVILTNERRQVQAAVDVLFANALVLKRDAIRASEDKNRRLVDLGTLLADAFDGTKTVEWCGRARVVATGAVSDKEIHVPRTVYETLQLNDDHPVLVTNPADPAGAFVALVPRTVDDPVIRIAPANYDRLALAESPEPLCIVHRPLGAPACAEARRLLDGTIEPVATPAREPAWFDAGDLREFLMGLADAALQERPAVLDSPAAILAAGCGSIDFADDTDAPAREERYLEVARPEWMTERRT